MPDCCAAKTGAAKKKSKISSEAHDTHTIANLTRRIVALQKGRQSNVSNDRFARIGERGKAEDQNARGVSAQIWYKHSNGRAVIRPKDAIVAKGIATAVEHACSNKRIGDDQYQQLTLRNAAREKGYDPAKATAACETDCSALVRVCCAYAGIVVSNFRTADEVKVLRATGKFHILDDREPVLRAKGSILPQKLSVIIHDYFGEWVTTYHTTVQHIRHGREFSQQFIFCDLV